MPRARKSDGPPGPPPILSLLTEAARVYGQVLVDHMAANGVDHSFAQSRLMGSVPVEGIRLTDLADRLGVTKQSCGQMVDDLVADGYLVRRPDPADGRAKLIFFGPEGDRSLPQAWAALHAVEDELARVIGRDALEAMRGWLAAAIAAGASGDGAG